MVACAGAALALLGRPALADRPESSAASPQTRRAYVVAAMGDSITDARSHGGKYLQLLSERCPSSRFYNYGQGGHMVNQMRARFARDVLGQPADPDHPRPHYSHVIVFGGVNDVGSDDKANRTPDTISPWGGFRRLFTPRRGEETRVVNRWIEEQKAGGRVDQVVDAYRLLSCGEAERLCPAFAMRDGLHLNAAGHRALGEAMLRQVFADCQ